MELFQAVEQQPSELQQGASSVLWLGAALLLVWLLGVGRASVPSLDSFLSGLITIIQTIF